jgi:hypothetical protein
MEGGAVIRFFTLEGLKAKGVHAELESERGPAGRAGPR